MLALQLVESSRAGTLLNQRRVAHAIVTAFAVVIGLFDRKAKIVSHRVKQSRPDKTGRNVNDVLQALRAHFAAYVCAGGKKTRVRAPLP